MRILPISLAACAATIFASAGGHAATSKEVLLADYPSSKTQHKLQELSAELCWDETCDTFVARDVHSDSEVWDGIFLHQFYFDQNTSAHPFRTNRAAHLSTVLASYSRVCRGLSEESTTANCVMKYLSKRNKIDYFAVRYDEGHRCAIQGDFNDPAKMSAKSKCTRYKHAP